MKQDTKETIGSRGTVAGFRPLIGEERWHRDDFTAEMLDGGWRPLLLNEARQCQDEAFVINCDFRVSEWVPCAVTLGVAIGSHNRIRTKRPLPSPQVEIFEAHGHVWYRHVPGDACPVEPGTWVNWLARGCKKPSRAASRVGNLLWKECGGASIIGYRFPGFPAVHTTLQQQQGIVQHVEKTEQSFQHDTTKQHLLTMYHGWCDVAPDSVAECIADVAKVLYPTDADRCEAEFQKWWSDPDGVDSDPTAIWHAAWQAAKQQNA